MVKWGLYSISRTIVFLYLNGQFICLKVLHCFIQPET